MASLPTSEPVNVNAGNCREEDANFQTTDENFNHLKTKTNSRKHNSEEEFRIFKQMSSKENILTVTSAQNRKRTASRDIVMETSDTHKQSRSENHSKSDEVMTSSEQGNENPDSSMDIISKSHILLDSSVSTTIDKKIPCIEESYLHKQEMEVLDLSKKRNVSSVKNTLSKINICQNVNPSGTVSDHQPEPTEDLFSVDATPASPVQSRSYGNIPESNVSLEKFQNRSPLESETTVETQKKPSMCGTCRMVSAKNVNECTGNIPEIYCQCKYICNICGVRYIKEGSHEIGLTCNVCQLSFLCKTQLEDHYIIHEKHHLTYCRICGRKLDEHVEGNEKKPYKCCQISCPFASELMHKLRNHLYTHSYLELYKCQHCGWRFTSGMYLQRHYNSHPKCDVKM